MNKKQLIGVGVGVFVFLSGCTYYYKYHRSLEGGYVIQKGADLYPEFTIDESRQYPQDLKVAKERFRRRKKFVENWYKKYEPGELMNPNLAMIKEFFLIPLLPIRAIAAALKPPSKDSEQELEESRRRYSEARRELENYIAQDCKREREALGLNRLD